MRQVLAVTALALSFFAARADEPAAKVTRLEAPSIADTGPRPDLKATAKRIVTRTNGFRKDETREKLTADETLTEAAQKFADWMATELKYGHTADDRQPAERAKAAGYDYCVVLENIAYVFDSEGFAGDRLAEQLFTGWKESPGHRKNMLDPDVTETGVAVARSEATGHYLAVQLFGRPKSAMFTVEVANDSGREVEYTLGDDSFTLPARARRTHSYCRPLELKLVGGDPVTPEPGDRFTVVAGEDGLRLRAEVKPPASP